MRFVQTVQRCDTWVFLWLITRPSYQRQGFLRFVRGVSHTGDGYLYLALAVALYFSKLPSNLLLLQIIAVAFGIERGIYFVLKNTLKRNRPFIALQNVQTHIMPSDKFSFPSGHTSAAFLMATLLTHAFPIFASLFFSWAALIGLSRVILRVHFPTDVLIGALLGCVIALSVLEFFPL